MSGAKKLGLWWQGEQVKAVIETAQVRAQQQWNLKQLETPKHPVCSHVVKASECTKEKVHVKS